MDIQEIRETPIWGLYEKGRNYHRQKNVYVDTDRNYRMYNGDQWEGAKLGGVEPVQKNFIKPIVKYKVSVIHDNLYAINFSSQNYENRDFRKAAEKYCDMLNRYAANVWERDKMDFKGRRITKDAAINDEGILYVNFDEEKKVPINEVVDKNDIYYGNENDDDIQAQPYILIRKRMPVINAIELAKSLGMTSGFDYIIGDNDTFEEAGEDAKIEVDNMVTVVYKFYKENGTVHFSVATRWVEITGDNDTGLSLYPIAHFNWEERKGSARGEGEVRYLIPNQIEVNRTEMRRVLTVKQQAYPMKVADVSRIANPQALDSVGGVIKTNGQMPVDDVNKIVGTIQPAMMSPDVVKLQEDLINMTRDLAGAGDTATGQVDPESASGRAILAVQQASQAPMTEQKESYKNFIEDVARIWLEYIIVYSQDGINMEQEVTDPNTGEETVVVENVPQSALQQLQATVRIDITPKGVYDKFAQEQTIENLLINGLFHADRVSELKAYAKSLDDDSVAPKAKILEIVEGIEEEQQRIAMIQAQAQMMQQRAHQFLMEDPDGQAQKIADAESQLEAQMAAEEAEYAEQEAELDEETAEEEAAMDEE